MKKIFLLLTAFAFVFTTFATGITNNSKNANNVFLPIGNNTEISLMDLSKIKVKDFEIVRGKHLNFVQKISFKAGQKKLRKSIAADGTITNKKLVKALSADGITSGLNIGWLALGFLLGLIGVVLSYVISGDDEVKKNRQKWAWIGFGVAVVLYLLVLL